MNYPIPGIAISLAPPEEIPEEPYSPFSSKSFSTAADHNDGFRAQLLSPPPTGSSPRFPRQLSPLCPPDSPVLASGLQRERFEAMLKASKERSMAVGAKKGADLRKEIAQKTHKNKQLQRRALFLSKLREPPCPSAVFLPKTPPESPAIFHYTLPSPGLHSPLALFDALEDNAIDDIDVYSVEPWVEQVDFRLPEDIQSKSISKASVTALRSKLSQLGKPKPIPSLDQITAHLSSHKQVPPPNLPRSQMRLPAFLQSHKKDPPRAPIPTDVSPTRPLSITVGRLKMPTRSRSASPPQEVVPPTLSHIVIPSSPRSPVASKLQVTTTIVPRSASLSPTELSERNVFVLTARASTAKDMLSTLKRRSCPSEDGLTGYDLEGDQKERRRRSSPAEMSKTQRLGFEHPVLSIPGGF